MAGYQENRRSFTAKGNSYIYSSEGGSRDETGSFPGGERAIGYKRHFEIPYIGLADSCRYDSSRFEGSFKYSRRVKAPDNGGHCNPKKRITYRDDVSSQDYCSVSPYIGYYITPAAKVYIEETWNRITDRKGDTSLYSRSLNISDHIKDGAGIENCNSTTTAGLKCYFQSEACLFLIFS